jgi:hypothetical protein
MHLYLTMVGLLSPLSSWSVKIGKTPFFTGQLRRRRSKPIQYPGIPNLADMTEKQGTIK